MTEIIATLDEIDPGYTRALLRPLGLPARRGAGLPRRGGGARAVPGAGRGGGAAHQLAAARRATWRASSTALGAPRSCCDVVVSSGDAAQAAMAAGQFGRRVYHIGPERDLGFFRDADGRPLDVERVPLEEAEGIVCTGLFDDRTETPDDYRATILYGKTKGLKLLCANPDIVVDVGDRRIYCAGAIAAGLRRGRRAAATTSASRTRRSTRWPATGCASCSAGEPPRRRDPRRRRRHRHRHPGRHGRGARRALRHRRPRRRRRPAPAPPAAPTRPGSPPSSRRRG